MFANLSNFYLTRSIKFYIYCQIFFICAIVIESWLLLCILIFQSENIIMLNQFKVIMVQYELKEDKNNP